MNYKNIAEIWPIESKIAPSNFKYKSLSNFSFNPVVGCLHACGFCYVPEVSAGKLVAQLAPLGVEDPDSMWGHYAFVRDWDEDRFLRSLLKAEGVPCSELPADGHRAVMFSTTTDAYQTIRGCDPQLALSLNEKLRRSVRRALELILFKSTLNVRVLTRSPLVQVDFDLLQQFGTRLVLGMSIPTVNDAIARIYEPGAPSVLQRLKTLHLAKAAGLHVFVAVAPTYPECDEADLLATLKAVREVDPLTIFHEPINLRAQNVARIAAEAARTGTRVATEKLATGAPWRAYALEQLRMVESVCAQLGLADRLHLWPDATLGSKACVQSQPDPVAYRAWLNRWWHRTSEWPVARPS